MSATQKNLADYPEQLWITDGGLETTLIFEKGIDLPEFASFDLFHRPEGLDLLKGYYSTFANIAQAGELGLMLDTPTWRANSDWGQKLGYSTSELETVNQKSVEFLRHIQAEYETPQTPILVSGCIGPRADGYIPETQMTAPEAAAYHTPQIQALAGAGVDVITAATVNYTEEAIGMAHAAQATGCPILISFTVETDGKLPTGQSLEDAIKEVDAATDHSPFCFMINCAHPTHFAHALTPNSAWVKRIKGIRANASRKSHAELNESTELDSGNPREFGQLYQDLRSQLPHLSILGGCCGTDYRHVEAICQACLPIAWSLLSQGRLST